VNQATTTPTPAAKPSQHSILLNLLPHILETFKREPALAITLGYLLVAMAGIFYNYSFYERFGIPVLSLSQISDFLVAGIQQPVALLLVASTFPLLWLSDLFRQFKGPRRAERRRRLLESPSRSGLWRLRVFLLGSPPRWFTACTFALIVVAYSWEFVSQYANYRVAAVREGDSAKVAIWLNGDASGLATQSGDAWIYLGAVANYVFVYDAGAGRSVILPVNNIGRMEPVSANPKIVAPIP
jgi:hypothetical protein